VLVVLHDIYLDEVTDVALIYPERRRDDGRFYVIDFTWAELGALSLCERRRPGGTELRFPGRFPYELPDRICRLEDEIALVSGLNATTGRHVGIYPEIKDPAWHLAGGIDLTALVHDTLAASRDEISGPVFVQSFDPASLRRLRDELGTEFALVQLLRRDDAERLERDAGARAGIAEYAVGVGVPFETLIEPALVDGRAVATPLPGRLTEAGLLVHPYTLRRDVAPGGAVDYFAALRLLINELEVDAIFCDHPDDAIAVRARSAA
jgi:glycerophosphoryl diester phosphodiesterase